MTLPIRAAESGLLPDRLVRFGIRRICAERLREEEARRREPTSEISLADELRRQPIATFQDDANRQHYELPARFFERVLGRHLKYSCCLWLGDPSLDEAERRMLQRTCERAGIDDGMRILDLGCGWGSLSLYVAHHYPRCQILAVSNSATQRRYVEKRAEERGHKNLRVLTADVATLELDQTFDRILSIEMFEHMRNYERLLERIASWLEADGRLFVHLFAHRAYAYTYETEGRNDWMARTFFTGGLMPSADLLSRFDSHLELERQWHIDGRHYQRTANAWLQNLDEHETEIEHIFETVYGQDRAQVWLKRWRIFFMACAELFGYDNGAEWGVEHLLFAPRRRVPAAVS